MKPNRTNKQKRKEILTVAEGVRVNPSNDS